MISLFICSFFVWDYFGRGYRMLNKYLPKSHRTRGQSWRHQIYFILAMPWLIFLQAMPRITALYAFIKSDSNQGWDKTARTMEKQPTEVKVPSIDPTVEWLQTENRTSREVNQ